MQLQLGFSGERLLVFYIVRGEGLKISGVTPRLTLAAEKDTKESVVKKGKKKAKEHSSEPESEKEVEVDTEKKSNSDIMDCIIINGE